MNTEIVNNGFGGKVVRTELTLLIECITGPGALSVGQPVRVHLFHGTPAHPRWYQGQEPMRSFKTVPEAQEFVDRLGGLVNTHKHFPVVSTTW